MNILLLASMFSGVSEEKLFRHAYDYYEVRRSDRHITDKILWYLHSNEYPQTVEDYCLEVLSNRVFDPLTTQ